jgi:serpin B
MRLGIAVSALLLAGIVYWGYHYSRDSSLHSALAASTLQAGDLELIDGYNRFGNRLFLEAISQSEASANRFLSPYSAAVALSMAYNGASGKTAEEMARVLLYPSSVKENVNRSNNAILGASIQRTEKTELQIANSIWLRKGISFKPGFLAANKSYYNSKLDTLDFADSSAPRQINDWVKQQTNGKIDSIVDPAIGEDVISILLNAVYFNGEWSTPFYPGYTKEQPFKREDGTMAQVKMMHVGGEYAYAKTEQAEAVRLPYGDGRLGMTVYIPGKKTKALPELAEWLLGEGGLKKISGELRMKTGSIALPRFKLEDKLELNEILKGMGMASAFNPQQADFGGIAALVDGNIYLSKAMQKTYVEVNERGTEAAAVTKIEISATGAQVVDDRFQFEANRPFFFTISDQDTGLILFMGSVSDPRES